MKRKWFLKILILSGLLLFVDGLPSLAQGASKPPKSFTLLYSNNINGEIDPCPG